jgi:hypothetical protein
VTVLVGSEVIDVLHCYELLKGRLSKVKKKGRRRRVGEGSVYVRSSKVLIPFRIAAKQISISSNHVKSNRRA